MKDLDYNLRKVFKKYFYLDKKGYLSEDENKTIKLLSKDLESWFGSQYVLFNVFDRIKSVKMEDIHFEKTFFNRIEFYTSFITFYVELTDENRKGYCQLYLEDICNGSYKKSDFSLCKVRWL